MADKPLTRNQQIFVDEYLVDRNASRAYKIAYPNVKRDVSARNSAVKLLTRTYIKNKIDKAILKQQERIEITQDFVLNGIIKNVKRCESEENFQPKTALKGYELLGRYLKLFTDKIDHGVSKDSTAALKEMIKKVQGKK